MRGSMAPSVAVGGKRWDATSKPASAAGGRIKQDLTMRAKPVGSWVPLVNHELKICVFERLEHQYIQ